jgi:hypothetical protein
MTIKKTDEEVTYKKVTTMHTFEVNGKTVRVYEHIFFDIFGGDKDYNIDERDAETLTKEEVEELEDKLPEILKEQI